MYCIIYKITNLLGQKCYVGQTWQPMKDRFIQHACKNDSAKLFHAMKKYGKDNFTIECLTIVSTQALADYYEIYFISKYSSNNRDVGYNISNGGKGVGKHSSETKMKISVTLSGRKNGPCSKEHKANMSAAKIGHVVSAETRSKISEANTGKLLSDEHIKNIGIGHTGLKYKMKDPETRNHNISEAKKKKNAERKLAANENKPNK
jgi:group I intron endonuclease